MLAVTVDERTAIHRIVYTAPTIHCSDGRINVRLDGRDVARTAFVPPGRTSTAKKIKRGTRLARRLTLTLGAHTFEFRFEGRFGGCNAGRVASWAGVIEVVGR